MRKKLNKKDFSIKKSYAHKKTEITKDRNIAPKNRKNQ